METGVAADFDQVAVEAFLKLGIEHPKEQQLAAVRALVVGQQNVFVQLPTGFGKSACFQALPLIYDLLANRTKSHMVLVITPLLAIINDQVFTLQKAGIKACSWSDQNTDMTSTAENAQVIYTTPESLIGVTGKEKNPKGLAVLGAEKVKARCVCIAIDEAHCCHKWEGFRPVYQHLTRVTAILGDTPIMALTATSTPVITKFLENNFLGKSYTHLKEDPTRDNIRLTEKGMKEADTTLAELLWELKKKRREMPRTLVFFRSLKDFGDANVKVRHFLEDNQLHKALYASYHSLHADSILQALIASLKDPRGEIRLVFATSAFGMGVDVPGITRVWHVEPPTEMDDLVQQLGRAARGNGETATHTLFFSGHGLRDVSPAVKEYALNTETCRQKAMSKFFGIEERAQTLVPRGHCCDLCKEEDAMDTSEVQ